MAPPLQPPNYTRTAMIGAVLAVIGIILFVLLWIGLGNAGVANAPRLFASMCVPPLIIGLIVGSYALFARRHGVSQVLEEDPTNPE
ncbi:MAG: hypothetical protein KME04_07295 [Pleurocapsa minor GSE-CHR-MK-17-07R]|jgi:lipopolysaccharide export LptBFGC system permease protein LptF|nr:hypothetical protein [Pleurocapsa minor GSE-CHR-MK 17-07R]